MSDQKPRPAGVDHIASFARLDRDTIVLNIAEPGVAVSRRHPRITLRRGSRRLDVRGDFVKDEVERKVVATVPRSELTDGIWRIVLRPGGNRPTPLEARLLVQGARPVVLLWGADTLPSRVPRRRRHPTDQVSKHSVIGRVGSAVKRLVRN